MGLDAISEGAARQGDTNLLQLPSSNARSDVVTPHGVLAYDSAEEDSEDTDTHKHQP